MKSRVLASALVLLALGNSLLLGFACMRRGSPDVSVPKAIVGAAGSLSMSAKVDAGGARPVINNDAGESAPNDPAPATTPEEVPPIALTTSSRSTDPNGMLLVPGGQFTMGSDLGGEEDEHPAHRVSVAGFYLDTLEVTVQDYRACMKAGICRMYREDAARSFHAGNDARFRAPKQPISGVSWDDADTYCRWVGKRLPREAEWERAASGDDRRHFVWGNDSPDPTRYGCFMRAVGPRGQTTCEVGSFPAGKGPYGHLDLAGNVWEWTADDYDPYAYRRATANEGKPGTCEQILHAQNEIRDSGRRGFTGSNPVPTTCEKVLRGGAFNYPGPGLRVTNRVHHPASWRMLVAGFRCARDATDKAQTSPQGPPSD